MSNKGILFKVLCLSLCSIFVTSSINAFVPNADAGSPLDAFDFQQGQVPGRSVSPNQQQKTAAESGAVPSGSAIQDIIPLNDENKRASTSSPTAVVTPVQFDTPSVAINPGTLQIKGSVLYLTDISTANVPAVEPGRGPVFLALSVYQRAAKSGAVTLVNTLTQTVSAGNSSKLSFKMSGLPTNSTVFFKLFLTQKTTAGELIFDEGLTSLDYSVKTGTSAILAEQSLSFYAPSGKTITDGTNMTIEGLALRGIGKKGRASVTVDLYTKGGLKVDARQLEASVDGVLNPISFSNLAVGESYYWIASATRTGSAVLQTYANYRHSTLTQIAWPPVIVPSVTVPEGVVGQSYSLPLTATGGQEPYTWGVMANTPLPQGLTINPSTGLIEGIPTAPSTATVQVFVRSNDGQWGYQTLTFNIQNPSLQIQVQATQTARVGEQFVLTPTATGAHGPIWWSIESGTMPPGLSAPHPQNGTIAGIPQASGVWSVVLRVQDSLGQSHSITLEFRVQSALLTIDGTVPNGRVGIDYDYQPVIRGGRGPYLFAMSQADIDHFESIGIGFNTRTGKYSGRPFGYDGPVSATLQVEDASGAVEIFNISFNIEPAYLLPIAGVTTAGRVGDHYQVQLEGRGGVEPYTWTISDADRAMLTARNFTFTDGLIEGTPDRTGTIAFDVRLTDAIGGVQTRQVSFQINPAAPAVNLTLAPAILNQNYTATLIEPTDPAGVHYIEDYYYWNPGSFGSMTSVGININTNGAISGTPRIPGVYEFRILMKKFDAMGNYITAGTKLVRLEIQANPFAITTLTLPNASEGQHYQQQILTSGGQGPITARLIEGQAVMQSYGFVMLGDTLWATAPNAPNHAGEFTFTMEFTDANGVQLVQTYTVEVVGRRDLRNLATNITGEVGQRLGPIYLEAQGGAAPLTWTIDPGANGDLENGNTLEDLGIEAVGFGIPGAQPYFHALTATAAGTRQIAVSVIDQAGNRSTRTITITITAPDAINDFTAPTIIPGVVDHITDTGGQVKFRTVEYDANGNVDPTKMSKAWLECGYSQNALATCTTSTEFGIDHTLRIDGRIPNRITYYRIAARDQMGNIEYSDVMEMQIRDVPVPDHAAPMGSVADTNVFRTDNVSFSESERFIDIPVLANDYRTQAVVHLKIVSGPASGRVRIDRRFIANAPHISVNYLANEGFVGSDSFTYQVCHYGTGNVEICSAETGQVNVTVTASTMPEITYLPNLSGNGIIAYQIKNFDQNRATLGLPQIFAIVRPENDASGLFYETSISTQSAMRFGHGTTSGVSRDGIYYLMLGQPALQSYPYTVYPMNPNSTEDYYVSIDMRFPTHSGLGSSGYAYTDAIYAQIKSGIQEKLVVQMTPDPLVKGDGTVDLFYNVRGVKSAKIATRTALVDAYSPTKAVLTSNGYVKETKKVVGIPGGTLIPGQANQVTFEPNTYFTSHFHTGGGYPRYKEVFTVKPIDVRVVLTNLNTNVGNVVNTGIGTVIKFQTSRISRDSDITMNIYAGANTTQVLYTVTVRTRVDGVIEFFIPSTYNGVTLYNRTLYYDIVTRDHVTQEILGMHPAPGQRTAVMISRANNVNPSVQGTARLENNQKGIRFQGTIPNYDLLRLDPATGEFRYSAYIEITMPGGTPQLFPITVTGNAFNVFIPFPTNGFGNYTGITARLRILPEPSLTARDRIIPVSILVANASMSGIVGP